MVTLATPVPADLDAKKILDQSLEVTDQDIDNALSGKNAEKVREATNNADIAGEKLDKSIQAAAPELRDSINNADTDDKAFDLMKGSNDPNLKKDANNFIGKVDVATKEVKKAKENKAATPGQQ